MFEGSEMLYPMYVLSMADFLDMQVARPHEALKADVLVFEHRWLDQTVSTFVSHQWIARQHPDPTFAQLMVLQNVVRNALEGSLQIDVDLYSGAVYKLKPTVQKEDLRSLASGCMWYDFFSVPQPDSFQKKGRRYSEAVECMARAI